jgi:hypothetical protein
MGRGTWKTAISAIAQRQISSIFYLRRACSTKKRRLDATLCILLEITIIMVDQ